MQQSNVKIRFLGLVLVAIAASSHLTTACSSNNQTEAQAPSSTATNTSSQPEDPTNHSGMMDHSKMDLGPADAEFDLRFIDSMIPHHEGAVIMAKEVLQKSKRSELRKLAQQIIKAQETEINQMKQWRATWYPKAPATPVAWHAAMGHSMEMSEEQMQAMRMNMNLGAADANFDKRFIDAMIPHHEGAIVMAKDALQKSKRTEIVQLAKNIVVSQQVEISQMKEWRKSF